MNKKADTPVHYGVTLINLIFVFFAAGFMVFIVASFANEKYENHDLESKMLVIALIYDDNCLAYKDFRVNPGIIDFNKFSDENLKKCHLNPYVGYATSLFDLAGNKLNFASSGSELNNYLPVCNSLPKLYKCSVRKNYVLYSKDNNIQQGILMTEVITFA